MDPKNIESLLEAGIESQRLDYKESCIWDVKKFAKDILAMANVQDGGYIIIGIGEKSDGTFGRIGITSSDKAKYKRDIMMDQMTEYADPHVNFNVFFHKDKNNLEYVVIYVESFIEIPVVCRKDSPDTKKGGIYYRNRNRRIESALISNSYDVRDLMERSAVKLMQKFSGLGLAVKNVIKQKLKEERGNL